MTEQPTDARPQPVSRRRKTAGDLVRSMAVVLVLVGVIVAFNVAGQPDEVVRVVDYPSAIAQARSQAPYDVLGPDPLPGRWRVTSARTEQAGGSVSWHLGMVTRDGDYAAVEQTDGDRDQFVQQFAAGASRAGTARTGELSWQRLEDGEPEDRAMVRTVDGVTTAVVGSASWDELAQLAESLSSE